MKRVILLLLLPLFLIGATSSDITLAKQAVEDFYIGFKTMSEDPESDACQNALYHCISVCGSPELMMFPNEIEYISNSSNSSSSNYLAAQVFISSFRRYMMEKPTVFRYSVTEAIPFYEAEWKKSDSQASFVYCIVDKSYSGVSFRDTVLLDGNRKIVGICNKAGGNAYTISQPVSNNIQALELRASKFYTSKQFSEAYATYQSIISKDASNVNANYRLAIMSYKREGCKQFSKKETDRMAMKYLRKARANALSAHDTENVEKFDNILYYWN